ncbi:MAG: hypoxanthine phosphoribosyltransferase [Ardenticatenaceae bacterium]|nr:hypoxanthine phosphoribosyltransferase [Ardenticatenaceae bacterium]
MRDLYADIDYVLLSTEQIRSRTAEMAEELAQAYQDSEEVMFLCVLKGGYVFMSDLSRACKFPHTIEFMAVSSYGDATHSSGAVQILLDLQKDISNRDVLIIEDIVDTGLTLSYMRDNLLARQPKSLRICSLLSKPSRHKVDVPIDFLGFEVPDEFVVGYGLDFAQIYRNFPFIAVLKPEVFGG